MPSPVALIVALTGAWLAFISGLSWLERRTLGPRDLKDTATASAATFVQVAVLGLGGLWFAATHPPVLDVAPDQGLTVVICVALAKWAADLVEMLYTRSFRAYDVLHHAVSGALLVYGLWVQTGAWFLGVAVFLSEVPGMTFFATQTLQRAGLAPLSLVLGLRCLHFVLAATVWLLLIPAFTLYFLQSWGFTPLMVTMCAGYNVFTLWSAHKLLTRTPGTLRKMARELAKPAPPSSASPLPQR